MLKILEEQLQRKRRRDESHTLIDEYVKRIKATTDSTKLLENISAVQEDMKKSGNSFIVSLAGL